MLMRHIYTSLDIGSDSIKVVVCELCQNKINLLAASSCKSKGIKKGLITDVELAGITIKQAIDHYLITNTIDGNTIKDDLKKILEPLFNTISFINYPPDSDLQPPAKHTYVSFAHYNELTKGHRGHTRTDLASNIRAVTSDSRTIFYYEFADHSDDCTIYLFPRGILDLAKKLQYDLNQVKQILKKEINNVTKPQEEGIVSDEDEQQS